MPKQGLNRIRLSNFRSVNLMRNYFVEKNVINVIAMYEEAL